MEEEKTQIQQEKEQLLAELLEVKEAVNIALLSMILLEPQVEERVMNQVEQLAEDIQQLQQWIIDLELHAVPDTT
jgi:hypothetical protein